MIRLVGACLVLLERVPAALGRRCYSNYQTAKRCYHKTIEMLGKSISKNVARGSGLDTIEKHCYNFAVDGVGGQHVKKSFQLARYRHRNLTLANALGRSTWHMQDHVRRVMKGLRCCCSASSIQRDKHNQGFIAETSKRCRGANCAICSAIRSRELVQRLNELMDHKDHKQWFNRKQALFLTLTVKHGKGGREGIYLKEFRGYMTKLKRSRWWRKYVCTKGGDGRAGWVSSIEVTLGGNGFHIHSHSLLFCDKLKSRVNDVQSELSAIWHKITGDSKIVSLDLVRPNDYDKQASAKTVKGANSVAGAVREVFKYSLKTGKLKDLSDSDIEMLGEWIARTRGKNFVNVGGYLRGHKLTSADTQIDMDADKKKVDYSQETYAVRTSRTIWTTNPSIELSTKAKRDQVEKARLVRIAKEAVNVTGLENWKDYAVVSLGELSVADQLVQWGLAEAARVHRASAKTKIEQERRNRLIEQERLERAQLLMFRDKEKENSIFVSSPQY